MKYMKYYNLLSLPLVLVSCQMPLRLLKQLLAIPYLWTFSFCSQVLGVTKVVKSTATKSRTTPTQSVTRTTTKTTAADAARTVTVTATTTKPSTAAPVDVAPKACAGAKSPAAPVQGESYLFILTSI